MAVELNKLLQLVVDKNASDLHLTCGLSPTLRLHGNLRPLNLPHRRGRRFEAGSFSNIPGCSLPSCAWHCWSTAFSKSGARIAKTKSR